MSTAHLLHGYLGAGKTTFARRLEAETGALRFTPDAWMAALFGADPPADLFQEKAAAILALLEPVWTGCLRRGVDVVLDYGFWSRAERDHVRARVQGCGAVAILYDLQRPPAAARRSVAARNSEPGPSLHIADATFDLLQARFEPLHADEARVAVRSSS